MILESLIHAARGLGKRTIAEYVEDAETVELLRELGVDMVQGFHIGVPLTAGRGDRYVVFPIACSAVGRIVSSGT